ncbi:hypothetical protein BSLA_02f4113 [Burkholderia stabilis]|nr:hypothetical protein BSLA_02f4113 [Burkholderia stabilis]
MFRDANRLHGMRDYIDAPGARQRTNREFDSRNFRPRPVRRRPAVL